MSHLTHQIMNLQKHFCVKVNPYVDWVSYSIDWLIDWLFVFDGLMNWLIDRSIDCLMDRLIDWLMFGCIHLFSDLFTDPFRCQPLIRKKSCWRTCTPILETRTTNLRRARPWLPLPQRLRHDGVHSITGYSTVTLTKDSSISPTSRCPTPTPRYILPQFIF